VNVQRKGKLGAESPKEAQVRFHKENIFKKSPIFFPEWLHQLAFPPALD
jgi:hypothetical protein